MDAAKLEQWLRRERKHAARLRLLATEIGSQIEVASWPREEILGSSSPVELVLCECADYCDSKGESINFRIEWQRADGTAMANCWHRHAPIEGNDIPVSRDGVEADISTGRLIAALLRKDEQKDRLIVGSIAAIFAPLEHTIRLQQQIIEQQGRQLLVLNQQAMARLDTQADREATEEERTEALARAGAWNKLAEVGPHVAQAVLEHVIERRSKSANGSGAV